MTKKEIIETVCELYDVRREAKDYLDYWINPDPSQALEDFKTQVDKMFFYSTGKSRSQPAAATLRQLVKYFSTLVFDSDREAELLMYIAERQYLWVTQKSGNVTQSEKSVRRAYDNAYKFIENAAPDVDYTLRLQRLKESIDSFFSNPPSRHRRWWRRW